MRLLHGSDLKTYLLIIGRGLMLWLLLGPPDLRVGFLLLRYSVIFTVESLSCFISFLYLDVCVLGDDALIS